MNLTETMDLAKLDIDHKLGLQDLFKLDIDHALHN